MLDESDCVSDITEGLGAEAKQSFFGFLDQPQDTVSSGIESLAQSIDEFYSDEKVKYQSSGSYVQLIGDLMFEEPGEVHGIGDINIRLSVPHTQKKLRLLLESKPEEQRSTVERVTNQVPQSGNNNDGVFLGVQRELGREEKWRFKPSLGLRLRFPIDTYVRLRANRTYQYENWRLYLALTPYWFDSTGFGFDSSMEWSYPLRDNLLFRSYDLLRYTDERDMFDFAHVFSLTHTLSSSRSISYEASMFADMEPTVYATEYVLLVRYRQRVHSDYLFMELVPQVSYRKEFDFNDEPSLLLRIEFLFKH